MPRVKRGILRTKKRRRLLKAAKGYKWGRKNIPRLAKVAVTKAGAHAYADRRRKKREFRRLWQIRLNAAARQNGTTYSKLIAALKKANIELDRKILADLAMSQPKIFEKIIEIVKK